MAIRSLKPLHEFVADYLGEAPGRAGGRRGEYWWLCPFHGDRNPSLLVKEGDRSYHCFACASHGDAVDFLMRLRPAMAFPEARAIVSGESADDAPRPRRQDPAPRPRPEPPKDWTGFALRLVGEAEGILWSSAGAAAREYLAGRKLSDSTIKRARLGLVTADRFVEGVFADKAIRVPRGILIPWFERGRPVMLNVRRPDGSDPKYRAIRGSRRGRPYPSASGVRPGAPLAIVEGEFEALILAQELGDVLGAVTFGSASDRPKGRRLGPILPASRWYVATDADAAGDQSADGWLASSARCIRVRPPGGHKDWTDAARGGVDLRRWWSDRLAGSGSPDLFNWDELARLRWSGADSTPGVVVDRPDRARIMAVGELIRHQPGDVTGTIDPRHLA